MSEQKRPVGRPTTYKPEYCQMLIEHMSQGFSFENFGLSCKPKVHRGTLYDWIDAHEEFADAKKIGHEGRLKHYETMIQAHLHMPKDSGTFSHPMMMFLLKTQYGYRDVTIVEEKLSPKAEAINRKLNAEVQSLKDAFSELGLLNKSGAI